MVNKELPLEIYVPMGFQFFSKTKWRYGVGELKHDSSHHIIPRSRGGGDHPNNILEINPKTHEAWHCLFHNLLPEEVIVLIEALWVNENTGKIKRKFLAGQKRQKAWNVIFGSATPAEAIEIIKNQFTKRES